MRDPLDIIEQRESGGKNVPNYKYGPGFTASGHYQMINATWRRWAKDAGIDVSQYPTAMSAPKEVQRAVAEHGFKTEGFKPWEATKHLVGKEANYGNPNVSSGLLAADKAPAAAPAPAADTLTLPRTEVEKLISQTSDPWADMLAERQKEQQAQQLAAQVAQAQAAPPPAAPAPPTPAPAAPPVDYSALLMPRLRRGLLADTGYGLLG